jgi:8-oxo-dGTP pyrophosphatase MutT (NUDIX family)
LLDAVDGGDVVKAAHREFQEETGYVATVGELVSGPVAYEPGLTNSGSRVVVLRVDPLDEHNVKRDASIYTSPEADEAGMETLLVPHTQNMLTTLQDMLVKDPSLVLDSRVHAYALALKLQ